MMKEKLRGQSLLVATTFTSTVSMVMRAVWSRPAVTSGGPSELAKGCAARDVWTAAAIGDLSFSASDWETPALWSPP